jgi:carbon-monoxide dehydrogenase medium subunit
VKPAPFEYRRPTSVREAVDLLHEHGDDAKVLAGGQSLVPLMNFRLSRPAVLIDLNGITELAYLREQDGRLALGAMTRQRTVETSPAVREHVPLLHAAMPWVGHLPIRTRGTIGGSLVHADPAAEIPVVAVALDAELTVVSRRGDRRAAAGDFFQTYLTTDIAPTELLTEIRLPRMPARTSVAFLELARRHGDFAIVAVAVALTLDGAGVIVEARIALGGVGPVPIRARAAEAVLARNRPSKPLVAEAADAAAAATDPPDDIHASAEYRRAMTAVFTRRAIAQALASAGHRS